MLDIIKIYVLGYMAITLSMIILNYDNYDKKDSILEAILSSFRVAMIIIVVVVIGYIIGSLLI